VPTETVYGLAADATNARACRRIFAAKRRPANDPLIVHIASLRDLSLVAVPNPAALNLAREFWPGPLTIVLPKTAEVPDIVTAGLPSVAVRMPSHPLFRRLIRLAGRPLAAPSANPFGSVSPTTAEHVRKSLGSRIRDILDGGPSRIGLESTIVDLRDPAHPALLRPGAITEAEISRLLHKRLSRAQAPGRGNAQGHVAPGQMGRHYSPRTPLVLHPRLTAALVACGKPDEAWLFIGRPAGIGGRNIFWLDSSGNLRRAARRLFSTLRRIDEANFRVLHAERAPRGGMGDALNDRLSRAAAREPSAGRVSRP
jgi:L-threonylcarbamoyladenylate synthase